MRVAVLGSTGMLGWAVVSFLKQKHTVLASHRDLSQAKKKGHFFLDVSNSCDLSMIPDVDYVINCIGAISHNPNSSPELYDLINARFPWMLSNECAKRSIRLIHVTSDCVFSGKVGKYVETDVHDPVDLYGASKSAGEPRDCMVIRTSIIGEEHRGKFNLLEWFKNQQSKSVFGYTNHFCNGLTTRAYADMCDQIMSRDLYQRGTWHVFSETKSKFEMLVSFKQKYRLETNIVPTESPTWVDRTLDTVYPLQSRLSIVGYQEMIEQL